MGHIEEGAAMREARTDILIAEAGLGGVAGALVNTHESVKSAS